jgi:hypothetical protein
MTITVQPPAGTAGREPGTCRYPGCGSPARASDAPGRPPGYCGREVPENRDGSAVLVRHTALAAFRRRQQLAGQPDDGRPVTAAINRAGVIRDDALAAMSRLSGQLTAVLDQLAVLGGQLAAAGDPEAAEAQAEAVRAEAAAQLEHTRAEAAGHAAARHAAELDAAEARQAAAEAVTMMETQAAALRHAGETAHCAIQELQDEQAAHAGELAAARAAAEDAARGREQDRQQHAAALAAANGTVTTLREQLARAEAALDRERKQQHETVALLHGLITSQPEPKTAARRQQAGR